MLHCFCDLDDDKKLHRGLDVFQTESDGQLPPL